MFTFSLLHLKTIRRLLILQFLRLLMILLKTKLLLPKTTMKMMKLKYRLIDLLKYPTWLLMTHHLNLKMNQNCLKMNLKTSSKKLFRVKVISSVFSFSSWPSLILTFLSLKIFSFSSSFLFSSSSTFSASFLFSTFSSIPTFSLWTAI